MPIKSIPGTRQIASPKIHGTAACGSWTPNFINSLSGAHPVSGRTERITFSWSSSALSALNCTGSTTFEPDFVTNNYDGNYYLGGNILSWTSNLPSNYLDTNFLDSGSEHVYTIGTNAVGQLASNFTYSNYIHTDNGNSNSDTAKIVWQRGHQVFGCPPVPITWCVFADASVIILAWNITLPGSYS